MKIGIGDGDPAHSIEEGWVFKKAFLLGNKADLRNAMEGLRTLESRFKGELMILPVSAKEEMNFEEVKKEVYRRLDILRVYTKIPGKEPDLKEPVIFRRGSTIEDVALSVHKDFAAKLRYARIWGSGKFDGQMVKKDYRVSEGDVIELHL
jgi:ribosome-interacting GTPase 1